MLHTRKSKTWKCNKIFKNPDRVICGLENKNDLEKVKELLKVTNSKN